MRPETGAMQFGDDWPGVFIRGDNAINMVLNLKLLLDQLEKENYNFPGMSYLECKSLLTLLSGSNAGIVDKTKNCQYLKEFKDCEKS